MTVDVATATDEDAGDTITVNLSNGNVTIIGPGIGAAGFSVHIEASDNHGANATPEDCGGTATAQIVYDFHGFFPPLDDHGLQRHAHHDGRSHDRRDLLVRYCAFR